MKKSALNIRGFTLIELLVVIVILAALAVFVFVALDPQKRTKDSRDRRRAVDVSSILTAIHLHTIDSKGTLPSGLSKGMSEVQLGTSTNGCMITSGGCNVTSESCLDLTSALDKYLESIPVDPNGTVEKTGYTVKIDSNSIVTVRACQAENTSVIYQAR